MFRVLLALLCTLLIHPANAGDYSAGRLYFLNCPETVRQAGGLGEFEIPAGIRGRVFFHFKNATGRGRTFTLQSDQPLSTVRVASTVSEDATYSGSTAALKFFRQKPRSPRPFSISVYVPVGQVISGIAEGGATKNTVVRCQMGEGSLILGATVSVTEDMRTVVGVDPERGLAFSMGDGGVNDNIGNYGVTHSLVVRNDSKTARKYDVYVSPRGGPATVVFGVDGTFSSTGRLEKYTRRKIASLVVQPGKTSEFTTMPVGGVAYPLAIEIRPQNTSASHGKVAAKHR